MLPAPRVCSHSRQPRCRPAGTLSGAQGLGRGLLFVSDEALRQGQNEGIAAIQQELERYGTDEDRELLDYVLNMEAGSLSIPFQDGMMLDRDTDGALFPERQVLDRATGKSRGMRLADFVDHPKARIAQLSDAHVLVLRLYTTAVFRSINSPLRDHDRIKRGEAHRLPVTVAVLNDAIRLLRQVEWHESAGSMKQTYLFRGMRDISLPEKFVKEGGTEFAPMSTTSNLEIAMEYSASSRAVLLRLRTDNFLKRGADVSWLSAFPAESEFLYPPLTFLKPHGEPERITIGECNYWVLDVTPEFA